MKGFTNNTLGYNFIHNLAIANFWIDSLNDDLNDEKKNLIIRGYANTKLLCRYGDLLLHLYQLYLLSNKI